MGKNYLTKADIDNLTELIQRLYLEDSIPWVCGYSGGKDSTAIVQLVWNSLLLLAKEGKANKPVHIISTDTLVESPVVATWLAESLEKMEINAKEAGIPVQVHRLTPAIKNSFWVNLIGRGYPYPRRNLRWCTERLKIEPANTFVEKMVSTAGEAILVLGTRKAESTSRRNLMNEYEKKRVRDHLNPSGSMPNSYVFAPIQDWSNDDVWQYLMTNSNPWGHSNKDLLAMYSGASADGECPLVLDTGTPSCGNSRFGCWVCTLVEEDKSMAAMIKNDEEKSWMLPLLDFRNEIKASHDEDRNRRDFRRMNGSLAYHNGELVHGPYTKKTREYFLKRLLEVELFIHIEGPDNIKNYPLITLEELEEIRRIWVEEKHEVDDSLPKIYQMVTGVQYPAIANIKNRFFSRDDWELLEKTCTDLYPDEKLLFELQRFLVDIESHYSLMTRRRGISSEIEKTMRRCFYKNEQDALNHYKKYHDVSGDSNDGSIEEEVETE